MSIKVFPNESNTIFELSNSNITYVFYINSLGIPLNVYFGAHIHSLKKNSLEFINNTGADCYNYLDTATASEVNCNEPYFSMHSSKLECPPYLTYDKRGPLIKVTNSDNSKITDFRYVDYSLVKGAPVLDKLPHIKTKQSDCETLIVHLKDIKSKLDLYMYYSIFQDKDVILRHNEIVNNTPSALTLERCYSFCLDLPSNEYDIVSLHGAYAMDREIERQPVAHNTIKIGDNYGCKGFYHNPTLMLKDKQATDSTGSAFGFALVYSSNFSFDITGDNVNQTRILGGIDDEDFSWNLSPSSKFTSPQACLVYSNSGTDKITNEFHDLIRQNLLPTNFDTFKPPILLNSWEACYFKFDTQKILNFIDRAHSLDIDLIVLDDGWFGKRDSDDCSLGDWKVNLEKIDLKKVIAYSHKLNIKFGLWIEPEMISYDSDLYKSHPEFALGDKDINPTVLRHQLILDLTNAEARQNVFDQICEIFDTYEIDYCKWDYNRFVTEAVSKTLPIENQGEVYHRLILGTYDLLERFTSRYPDIILETCAGGGGRFDMGMLYYSNQIWCSDETDATNRVLIQHATNMYYPLCTIGSHVSSRKYLSIKEKAAVALFGTFGYELDPGKLNEKEIDEVHQANAWFKKYKHLVDTGDYYQLSDPTKSNFAAWEVISKDRKHAVVFAFNFRRENNNSRFLKLKHLSADTSYKNSINNEEYFGDFYNSIGLNICEGCESYTPRIIELNASE